MAAVCGLLISDDVKGTVCILVVIVSKSLAILSMLFRVVWFRFHWLAKHYLTTVNPLCEFLANFIRTQRND